MMLQRLFRLRSFISICRTHPFSFALAITSYQPTPQEQAQRKRVSGFVLANPEKSRKRFPSASRNYRESASSKPSHLGPVGVVESCKKYAAQNGSSPKPCRRAKRSIRALRQILCEWELPSSTIRKAR